MVRPVWPLGTFELQVKLNGGSPSNINVSIAPSFPKSGEVGFNIKLTEDVVGINIGKNYWHKFASITDAV